MHSRIVNLPICYPNLKQSLLADLLATRIWTFPRAQVFSLETIVQRPVRVDTPVTEPHFVITMVNGIMEEIAQRYQIVAIRSVIPRYMWISLAARSTFMGAIAQQAAQEASPAMPRQFAMLTACGRLEESV
jgi:hypothetical protein